MTFCSHIYANPSRSLTWEETEASMKVTWETVSEPANNKTEINSKILTNYDYVQLHSDTSTCKYNAPSFSVFAPPVAVAGIVILCVLFWTADRLSKMRNSRINGNEPVGDLPAIGDERTRVGEEHWYGGRNGVPGLGAGDKLPDYAGREDLPGYTEIDLKTNVENSFSNAAFQESSGSNGTCSLSSSEEELPGYNSKSTSTV